MKYYKHKTVEKYKYLCYYTQIKLATFSVSLIKLIAWYHHAILYPKVSPKIRVVMERIEKQEGVSHMRTKPPECIC